MYSPAIYGIEERKFIIGQLIDRGISFHYTKGISEHLPVCYIDVDYAHYDLMNDLIKQAIDFVR